MKKLEQRVPNLRFKGFTDDWEQHKLGTLFQKNIERNDNEKFNYNQTLSVSTMTFKPTGNGASAKSLANYKVLRLGDVAFEGHSNKQFSYGRFVVNDNADGIMSPRFATIRPIKAININYWKNYLHNENIMKYVLVKSTKAGTMMNELVYSDLYKQVLKVPNITEQVKIGNLLQKIEIIITLQQRKLDLLKQLKKGFLQKMFADKDSKRPVLRFKGFHDDWEQRKGKSIFYSKSNKDFPELTVLSATQDKGMIPRSSTGIDIKYEKKSLRGYKKIEPGDFVVHLRSFQGGFAYSDLTGIVSPAYTVFTFKQPEMFNNYFWKEKFTSYNFIQLLKKVTYGVRDGRSISYSDFLTLNEKFPVKVEQTKIADLFKIIDNLIALQHQKLAKYQSVKKSLLQQMFI